VLPLIASILFFGIGKLFRNRFQLVRQFQEVMSFLGMGHFIAYSSHNLKLREFLLNVHDKLIRAYLAFVTPASIVSCYFNEIASNPILDSYFSQFNQYNEFKRKVMAGEQVSQVEDFNQQFLDALGKFWDWLEGIPNWLAYLADPKLVMLDFANSVFEELKEKGDDPFYVVDYLNSRVKINEKSWEGLYAPCWVHRMFNPFIDLDWAVIKSNIILYYVYCKQLEALLEELEVVPFLYNQLLRFYLDDRLVGEKTIESDGHFKVLLPYQGESKLRIESFGLKWLFEIVKMPLPPYDTYYITSYNREKISYDTEPHHFHYSIDGTYEKIWGTDGDPSTPWHSWYNAVAYSIDHYDSRHLIITAMAVWTPHTISIYVLDTHICDVSGYNDNLNERYLLNIYTKEVKKLE